MYAETVGYLLGVYLYVCWIRDKLWHTRFKDFSHVRESRSTRTKGLLDSFPTPKLERILEPLLIVPSFPKVELKPSLSISASSTSRSSVVQKKKEKRKKQRSVNSLRPTVDEVEMGMSTGKGPLKPANLLDDEEKDVVTAKLLMTGETKETADKCSSSQPEPGVTTAQLLSDEGKEVEENLRASKSPPGTEAPPPASVAPLPQASETQPAGYFDLPKPTTAPATSTSTALVTSDAVTTNQTTTTTTAESEKTAPTSGGAKKSKGKKKKGKKKKDKKKKKTTSDVGLNSPGSLPEARVGVAPAAEQPKKKKKSGKGKTGESSGGHTPRRKTKRKMSTDKPQNI